VDVHIWSDIVCPWCYLGKRRFEHALTLFDHRDEVLVTHRSFQLDPSRPRHETTNRRAMLKAKYRLTDDKVQEMDARMERLAEIEGLEYHLTDAGLTGNTLDAHQLLQLGKQHGVQDAVIERLYRAYFTEQRSVFERDSLVALAGEAGLDAAEARDVLERDAYVTAVEADVSEARSLGVSGVPFFVIDGRYGVSGAQATEVFEQALARAWDERDRRATASSAGRS
jgi:predicted DsbA family dithiol-disulfide isomerase